MNPKLLEQFFVRDDEEKDFGLLIDLTHRCALECPRCQRQEFFRDHGETVWGGDIPMDTIEKATDTFKAINFGGQLSDPIHHPNFIEILKLCYEKGVQANVQTASTGKPKRWFIKAFEANPNARWQFGIDGLPEESHKYRINQDGPKLFQIMCEAKNYLKKLPCWQYIIFKYNEEHIEQAKQMAKDNGLRFVLMQSHRWRGENDPYMPSEKYRLEAL
tara:strand:- start:5231 stop:5881 length:651 start_codon:yes stop_codon:yes gene_type:complete